MKPWAFCPIQQEPKITIEAIVHQHGNGLFVFTFVFSNVMTSHEKKRYI